MISVDSTTPVSAIMTLFVARRRFGCIYYDTIWSFCWWAGDEQFRSVKEVVKSRVKAVKKRERCVNMHAERRTRKLEWRGSKSGSKTYVEGMEAWTACVIWSPKRWTFRKRRRNQSQKVIECDWIEEMKVTCKDACTIGSLEELSSMRAMKPSWLHARNLKDSHTPQNTSKTCTNVDNVMIKL